ncbi:hemerythrin domain-containing protein [Arcticibacter eurypsychrophilus]|uniref:hemerythrin domain-containing protein n=1 Tax=Arcticibacter eurypsychrophilus TaxID=1434752 RepID=UPI00084E0ADC|nr:hemerythrin domain-containing protein [Arcticibacter eurypsychrophilus]
MKRHPSLAHLSREHHGALILSKLLQKDAPAYKGLPTGLDEKAVYALNFYKEDLVEHFAEEEKILKMVIGIQPALDVMIETIFSEHQELHSLFKLINNNPDLAAHLNETGKKLEEHVRKEERELFPMIQETCTEEMMIAIDKSLANK